MRSYPNYRIAVEIILLHNNKVLLTKRADHCEINPAVWNVPAGKVKYEEIPKAALFREAKEEINLDVEFIKELDVRAFKGTSAIEDFYRCVFTYLVKAVDDNIDHLQINEEHSEYAWVDKNDLQDEKYASLHLNLRRIILKLLDEVSFFPVIT